MIDNSYFDLISRFYGEPLKIHYGKATYPDFKKRYAFTTYDWVFLKVTATPRAVIAIVKAVAHLAYAIFFGVIRSFSDKGYTFKRYTFCVIRDLQECAGALISIFWFSYGRFHFLEAITQKHFYNGRFGTLGKNKDSLFSPSSSLSFSSNNRLSQLSNDSVCFSEINNEQKIDESSFIAEEASDSFNLSVVIMNKDYVRISELINLLKKPLNEIDLSFEELKNIAPFLEYVDCRGILFPSQEDIENFISFCKKSKYLMINSDKLININELPSSLEEFFCVGCVNLEVINFSNVKNLIKFDCEGCKSLNKITAEKLPNCEYFNCQKCPKLVSVPKLPLFAQVFLDHGDCFNVDMNKINSDSLEVLLDLGNNYLLKDLPMPNIVWVNSSKSKRLPKIDYLLSRREFVSKCFENLAKKDLKRLLIKGDFSIFEAVDDKSNILALRTIARLFGCCLTSPLVIGKVFDKKFYSEVFSLLLNETVRPSSDPIAVIANELKLTLGCKIKKFNDLDSFIVDIEGVEITFSNIQGAIDYRPKDSVEAVKAQNFFERIFEEKPETLLNFVEKCMKCRLLKKNEKIRVLVDKDRGVDQSPIFKRSYFHCILPNYTDYEGFCEKLNPFLVDKK